MQRYKKITPSTYIQRKVDDVQETLEETLSAANMPWDKIKRLLLLGAIAHVSLLVVLFTLILTVRYAIQL